MTISDVFPAAEVGGSRFGSPEVAELKARTGPRPRARVTVTAGDGNSLVASIRSDVVNAWPWTSTPPALREVGKDWRADLTAVPGSNMPLAWAWTTYNVAVAIPATAVGYLLTWVLQHPARLAALLLVATPLLILLTA